MRNSLKSVVELNFEDEQGYKNSVKTIRAEYTKKALKSILYILIVLTIVFSNILYGYLPYIEKNFFTGLLATGSSSTGGYVFSLNLTLSWTLFSTSIFLIIYFIKSSQVKFTPSLIKYIERETKYAGFEFRKKIESVGSFLLLSVASVIILFYIDTKLIQFDNSFWSIFLASGSSMSFCILLFSGLAP